MSETNEKSLKLRIKSLEHLLEIANEKVCQLEAIIGMDQLFPVYFSLTSQENRLLGALLKMPTVSKDAAMLALYSDRLGDAPNQKIIDVFVCKLRAKLKPYEIVINTVWGVGYSLPGTSKEKILTIFKENNM